MSLTPRAEPVKHGRNWLFTLVGVVITVLGVALAVWLVYGIATREYIGSGEERRAAMANDAKVVVWAFVAITVGRYIWRGDRRRGWKDRLGRLLCIAGSLLLGFAVVQAINMVTHLVTNTRADNADGTGLTFLIGFAVYGVPAAILMLVGARLAREEILMTATAKADLN